MDIKFEVKRKRRRTSNIQLLTFNIHRQMKVNPIRPSFTKKGADVTENVPPNILILRIEYEYRFAEYEKEKIPP